MNLFTGSTGIAVFGTIAFGGAVWLVWAVRDLIRYTSMSDDQIRATVFPKPRITQLAQRAPSRCRKLFIRFDLCFLAVSIVMLTGGAWAVLSILNKL